MDFISLFSGIDAASVAFTPLGWKALAFSEIEPFPCAVLKHHYPNVPNHGDITKFDWRVYKGKPGLVCGGPPCQGFSIAGLRLSLEDARGNLSLVTARIILDIKSQWVLLENVPGMLSTDDNAFGCLLAALSGANEPLMPGTTDGRWRSAGIVSGPGYGLAWRVCDAQFFGVPQRRERLFIVGYLGDWRPAATVLFEPGGLRRDFTESREEGEEVAGTLTGGARKSGGISTDDIPLAFKIRQGCEGGGKGYLGSEDKAFTVATHQDQNILQPIAFRKSRRAQSANDHETWVNDGIANTLNTFDTGERDTHAIIQPRYCGSNPEVSDTVCSKWAKQSGGPAGNETGLFVLQPKVYENHGQDSRIKEVSVAPQLNAKAGTGGGNLPLVSFSDAAVRRLTPMECERLQGFPDKYTEIPYKNKPAEKMSDSPRYKALGNSWAVPCARWIAERIQAFEDSKK